MVKLVNDRESDLFTFLQANLRLAGALSEDPTHPKLQFPSSKSCPQCKTPKGIWIEESVSSFNNIWLHFDYKPSNIYWFVDCIITYIRNGCVQNTGFIYYKLAPVDHRL